MKVGPGAQLKKLLALFGASSSAGCSCEAMASKMDLLGRDWVLSRHGMEEIVASIKKNALERGHPINGMVARALVRLAAVLSH